MTLLIVAAILFPIFAQSKDGHSPSSECLHHMKSLGVAMVLYEDEHDGRICQPEWNEALLVYAHDWRMFTCPTVGEASATKPTKLGYALSFHVVGKPVASLDASTIVLFETDALGLDVVANLKARSGRHSGGSNVGFADSTVRYRKLGETLREMP